MHFTGVRKNSERGRAKKEKKNQVIMENTADLLVQAAWSGSDRVLTQLLARVGADADAVGEVDGARGTPLLAASFRGQVRCVQALLAARAQIDLPGRGGQWDTALYNASMAGHAACVQTLLDGGASLQPDSVFPPLYVAANHGQPECVRLLLRANASIDVEHEGLTPLCSSAQLGYAACVQALIDAGADVNSGSHGTPLWLASQGVCNLDHDNRDVTEECGAEAYEECVRLLLAANASVDAALHEDSSTPMHVAAQNGNAPIVQLLLQAGADTTLCRSDGETPLDAAHRNGHSECVELLTSRRRWS